MLSQTYRRFKEYSSKRAIRKAKRLGPVCPSDLSRSQWQRSLEAPLDFYLKCFRFFHSELPDVVRQHREYFSTDGRGFGEDAFHVMWFLLHKEFTLGQFLEIGVYRGQVLSLVSLLQELNATGGEVFGISPFSPAGDSVSRYREGIDYIEDVRSNFQAFALPEPTLLKAYSTDPMALDLIRSRRWDCIYIDGNHNYEVAGVDWANSAQAVKPGGLIVLDDSALTTDFKPPPFASKGHPGPSRIAIEADRNHFEEILQVGHNRVFQRIASSERPV
jgi:hypothetical protein